MEKMIEVKHLSKSFGNMQVLKNINLTLYKGENIVVMGKSGIGKSVLIKCIVGLIPFDTGEVILLGKNIKECTNEQMDELRTNIGYLFQGGAIYDSMSVRENLEFQVKRHSKIIDKTKMNTLVEEALGSVNLLDAIHKKPSELSGGMRKRLGLARSIMQKPKILFYDEPTTGLDPVTSKEISHLILDIQRKYNTSSIIVTHDIKCAEITANRIKMLKDGDFYTEGTFTELAQSSNDEVYTYFN